MNLQILNSLTGKKEPFIPLAQNKEKVLDQMIDETVMLNDAKSKGYEKNADFLKQLDLAKRQLILAAYLKDMVDNKVSVNEKEVSDYYQQNAVLFAANQEKKFSHILVATEDDAKDILKSLKTLSFAELASKKSLDSSGRRGGEIGWFVQNGQLVKEFEDAAFALKNKGDVSPIVKTQFGYHIIRLDDVATRNAVTLSDAKSRIEQVLRAQKQQDALKTLVDQLKSKSIITKDVSGLK